MASFRLSAGITRRWHKPAVERDGVLPACQHTAAERDHLHLANADDRKRILSDLTVGAM